MACIDFLLSRISVCDLEGFNITSIYDMVNFLFKLCAMFMCSLLNAIFYGINFDIFLLKLCFVFLY